MIFNKGYLCKRCGPVAEAKKVTRMKVQQDCCKTCEGIVTPWERPLNLRPGRCSHCAKAHFKNKMGEGRHKGFIIQRCYNCDQVRNAETGEVLKQGKEGMEWTSD